MGAVYSGILRIDSYPAIADQNCISDVYVKLRAISSLEESVTLFFLIASSMKFLQEAI